MAKAQDPWDQAYKQALADIQRAHDSIEKLSDFADESVDQKICYASNTLRGSEALLREANALHRRGEAGARRGRS